MENGIISPMGVSSAIIRILGALECRKKAIYPAEHVYFIYIASVEWILKGRGEYFIPGAG
jgi:hypothetical protein